jgi:hypothetical protein
VDLIGRIQAVPDSATHWYIMGVNGWYIMGVNLWDIMGVNPWYIIACKLTRPWG